MRRVSTGLLLLSLAALVAGWWPVSLALALTSAGVRTRVGVRRQPSRLTPVAQARVIACGMLATAVGALILMATASIHADGLDVVLLGVGAVAAISFIRDPH